MLEATEAAAAEFGALKTTRWSCAESMTTNSPRRLSPHGAELRFIERWTWAGQHAGRPRLSASARYLGTETHYGPIRPIGEPSSAPAERFSLPDGLTFDHRSTIELLCASAIAHG